jgi:hypothetical protein
VKVRRIIITHRGSEAAWRIAFGIVARQIMRGSLAGREPPHWEYRVEIDPECKETTGLADTGALWADSSARTSR